MVKKTIDQKIDELARITTKGFRLLQKEVTELHSDVNELQEGFSWMRHEIEVMSLDIKRINTLRREYIIKGA